MTDDIFPNYPLIMCSMNEIQEKLGLDVNKVVRWCKNDVEKLFRRPKVVVCSNTKSFRK
jgi:hypothetical protein